MLILLEIAAVILLSAPRAVGQASMVAELKVHESVWVTTADGRTEEGRFRMWTDSGLDWETPAGAVRTSFENLERVEAPDPIADGILRGTLIGAGVGATYGALLGVGLSCETDCGADYSRTKDVLTGVFWFGVAGAGLGAVLGAVLDASIHPRRLVYARPSSVTLMPVIGIGRFGGAATVRW